jgi:hypothetical protein
MVKRLDEQFAFTAPVAAPGSKLNVIPGVMT